MIDRASPVSSPNSSSRSFHNGIIGALRKYVHDHTHRNRAHTSSTSNADARTKEHGLSRSTSTSTLEKRERTSSNPHGDTFIIAPDIESAEKLHSCLASIGCNAFITDSIPESGILFVVDDAIAIETAEERVKTLRVVPVQMKAPIERIRNEYHDEMKLAHLKDIVHGTDRGCDYSVIPSEIGLKKRVLIVDDTAINLAVLRSHLLKYGFRPDDIETATNGREAVDACNRAHFDVVLMDLLMPIMDGFQASAIITKAHPRLPVVAITASTTEEDCRNCFSSGICAMLSKPVNANRLRSILYAVLHKDKRAASTNSA